MTDSFDTSDSDGFDPKALQVLTEEMLPAQYVSRFSAVLAQEEFRTELNRLFLAEWGGPAPDEIQLRPLKAHKDRCTFEIIGRTGDHLRSLIGKVHDVDRSDIFSSMQRIVDSGFGQKSEFAIPRPLAYLSSVHVLFEEKIDGKWAMQLLLNGGLDEQIETARRCGTWLARFHSVGPRQGSLELPLDSLLPIRRWADLVKKFGDSFAAKSDVLSKELEAIVPSTNDLESSPGHGSYIPENVLLTDSRTIAIDLDKCDIADPSRDLASFIISVQRLGLKQKGSIRARDEAAKAFLDAYKPGSGENTLRHLPFFVASECLHRAYRDLYKRTSPMPQWASIMLDEGLRAVRSVSGPSSSGVSLAIE
jgi:phosphotransferase family enzyme